MPDDISDIRAYYEASTDQEDGRLARHPIERDVTRRYLDEYLPPTGRILEIGAATGAYTVPLARRGYAVTAVELAPSLLDLCRARVSEAGVDGNVTCLQADARELSAVTERDYDAALIMGPLYHLVEEADREQALREAHARLKPGGLIFSAFISRYGIWGDIMTKVPRYIEKPGEIRSVLERGRDKELPSWGAVFRAYFATPEEIAPLHERLGFTTLALAGIEPAGVLADAAYLALEEPLREKWLDLMVEISRESSILGASCHLLYVGKKA